MRRKLLSSVLIHRVTLLMSKFIRSCAKESVSSTTLAAFNMGRLNFRLYSGSATMHRECEELVNGRLFFYDRASPAGLTVERGVTF